MKKILAFLFLSLILLTVSSCSNSESLNLYACGAYSVPAMFGWEIKGTDTSCVIIDEDSEGRILFEYTTQNFITFEKQTAYVVCQKYDSQYVYFYEDNSFYIGTYEISAINLLKENNDWEQPINESKLSRREVIVTLDLVIFTNNETDMSKAKRSVCKALNIKDMQIKEMILDDTTKTHDLFILHLENDCKYWVIVGPTYSVAYLPIDNNILDYDALANFKRQNHWDYGF